MPPAADDPPREAAREDSPAGEGIAGEDYLKAVYKLQPRSDTVSTSELARELDRSAASVTNMVKRLSARGLLDYVPYRGVRLTPRGNRAALRILRRHRVIEAYLIEKLEFTWDDVHEEAERLEHAASDELVNRMARSLGEPEFDPHGAPIPSRRGEIERREGTGLHELQTGQPGVVLEVEDEDPDRLRHFASMNLFPGSEVEVCSRAPMEGPLAVRVEGEIHAMERDAARCVVVEEA